MKWHAMVVGDPFDSIAFHSAYSPPSARQEGGGIDIPSTDPNSTVNEVDNFVERQHCLSRTGVQDVPSRMNLGTCTST